MRKRFVLKIDRDTILFLAIVYFIMYEFFPIIHIINPIVLSLIRVFCVIIFYFYVYSKDRSVGLQFILYSFIALIVNCLAYYNCWCNYETIGSFLINSMMCWVYMQLGIYIIRFSSVELKESIGRTILIFACITTITSIMTLQTVPTAVRELANGSMHIKGMEMMLYRRNTSTWGGLYGMTFLLPYIVIRFKKEKKPVFLFCVLLITACVLRSQITAAILISLVFLALFFIEPPSPKALVPIGASFILLRGVVSSFAEDILSWLMDIVAKTNNEVLSLRLFQMYYLMKNKKAIGTIGGRFDLYMNSFVTFLKNPVLGYKLRNDAIFSAIGLHSQLFDMMAAVGIVGMVPLIFVFIRTIKIMIRVTDRDSISQYFLWSLMMLIVLMIFNPTWYAESVYLGVFCGVVICDIANQRKALLKFN